MIFGFARIYLCKRLAKSELKLANWKLGFQFSKMSADSLLIGFFFINQTSFCIIYLHNPILYIFPVIVNMNPSIFLHFEICVKIWWLFVIKQQTGDVCFSFWAKKTAVKANWPSTFATVSFLICIMPAAGLEPARSCLQQILSLPRLPFRHAGKSSGQTGQIV